MLQASRRCLSNIPPLLQCSLQFQILVTCRCRIIKTTILKTFLKPLVNLLIISLTYFTVKSQLFVRVTLRHSRAGVSNSRPGGQIRPATSFSVAPQELAKNIIHLLYGYMPLYRSRLPINYMSHNASRFDTEETCNYLPWTSALQLITKLLSYPIIIQSRGNNVK